MATSHKQVMPLVRLCALLLAVVPLALLAWRFAFVCDDAFISFRYARNLTEGLGLAFNPGVSPPIEGYTELGWVLLMALGLELGLDPARFSLILSLISGLLLILIVLRLMESVARGNSLAFLSGALFLGCLPSLGVWSTSGLATMPFCLALVACFSALHLNSARPRTTLAAVAAVALVLLRADGAIWVASCTGPAILAGLWSRNRALLRASLIAASTSALVFGAHVAWRVWYYADWLPNTARVKLGFSERALDRGLDYLAHFGLTFPGVSCALLIALLALRPLRERRVGLGLIVVLVTFGNAVLVGGDFMAFGRFLLPALPFVAIAWTAASVQLTRIPRVGQGLAILCALLFSVSNLLPAFDRHLLPKDLRARHHFRHNTEEFRSEFMQWNIMDLRAREWIDLGQAVAEFSDPGDSLVFGAVGAIGYYSRLFIYDLNGLVTREVALREPLGRMRSPGHDKTVEASFFLKDSPTWLTAFFVPQDRIRSYNLQWDQYKVTELKKDYDRVSAGDLFVMQPGPGFSPRRTDTDK